MLGISKETVHTLPEVHYPGRVILIDSAAKARDAVAYLMKQPQIGFDTETRPSFQKNHRYKVSLVQLSVPGECFLFRLKQIGSLDGLMSIFENPAIQKIGLSLKDDFHSLAKLCEFTPAGFVELQTFVKEYEIADNSLQKIFALIFGQRISKNQRLTNWEAAELTPSQQSYAAIDAWACVEIYNYLCAGKFHPEESPYRIDDQTALMLQSSVGIHLPLKHGEDNGMANDDTPSPAIAESTALNGKPVRRRTRKSAQYPQSPQSSKSPKSPKSSKSAKATKSAKEAKTSKPAKKTARPATKTATRKRTPKADKVAATNKEAASNKKASATNKPVTAGKATAAKKATSTKKATPPKRATAPKEKSVKRAAKPIADKSPKQTEE